MLFGRLAASSRHFVLGIGAMGMVPVASEAADPPSGPTLSLIGAVLNVADPDKQIAFYRDGMGMKLAMTLPGKTATEYMLSFGGDPRQPGIILQKNAAKTGPLVPGTAFNRLVLRVSDLDALAAQLDRAGYKHSPIRDAAQGYRMMMASDPEGNRLELVQSKAAQ